MAIKLQPLGVGGITDHFALSNIGVNTHAQIDAHIGDANIHFTEASIDHTAISNIGVNSHGVIDLHIADAGIHFTEASIDHTAIGNIGINNHVAIDGHIADTNIHYADAPADGMDYVRVNNAWAVASPGGVTDHLLLTNIGVNTHAQIDTHIADGTIHFTEASIDHTAIQNIGVNSHAAIDTHIADGTIHFTEASIDHTAIANIGVNSHAAIDLHIASILNPHAVTLQQAFTAGNEINSTTLGIGIPDMTEVQRDAIVGMSAGWMIFNTDTLQMNQYNGAAWTVPGGGLTTLQSAYDNSMAANPMILLDATPTPISIQASVSGAVLEVRDVAANVLLEVDADPDTIIARTGVTIDNAFLNGAAPQSLLLSDTFTTGGGFLGGGILSNGTVTYNNSFFIWALMQESKTYNAAAGPGFAAFTLFNALAIIQNSGNFNLVQGLVLNNGLSHRRTSAGTSTVTQTIGLSNSPNTRTNVAGAIMTKTTGDTAVRHSPTFATVAGSTVNMGTQRGLHCVQPAVALFQSAAGVENMTAYIGVEVDAIPFGGNVTKRGVRIALAAASNTRAIESTGTAESDHFGPFNLDADFPNGILRQGASLDYTQGWVATNELFQQIITPAVTQWRWSAPSTGRLLLSGAAAILDELNINVSRFSMGAQSGAVGNQVGNFVTPARTITVGGDWADFLLTQAGSLTVNALAMGRVSAWVINPVSYAASTGSVGNADTLTVGGFPTSSPGVTITERQSLHVIGGRSRHQAAMQYDPINPASLTAGNNNDYAGMLTASANNGMRHWVRLTPDGGGTSVITGIDATAAQDGDCFKLTNIGTVNLQINHQDAASVAANRILSYTIANYVLGPNESCEIIYDAVTARWRILYGSGA